MKRERIYFLILFLLGATTIFFIDREPYSSIAGFLAGLGFAGIFFGPRIIEKIRR